MKIQTFQNIALKKLMNAPPHVSNHTLHSDTKLKLMIDKAINVYKRFHDGLNNHPN